jgi:hypothetical protein
LNSGVMPGLAGGVRANVGSVSVVAGLRIVRALCWAPRQDKP